MRNVLKDAALQAEIQRSGFVVVPFLDQAEIQHLRTAYFGLESDLNHGFHATMHSQSADYRRKVSDIIGQIFNDKAATYLDNYRQLVSNYTVKEPDAHSMFDFHLDWSMVNEDSHISITIWCPLEDVNEVNGHLWILDKSHRLGKTLRGGPGLFHFIEESVSFPFEHQYDKLLMNLKAGEAVIYDHRLIHGSPPNRSNQPRLAINQAMIPTEIASWHYQYHGKEAIDIYEVDDDFYHRFIIGSLPTDVKKVGNLPLKGKFIQQADINSLVGKVIPYETNF